MLPTLSEPALAPMFGLLPDDAAASREEALGHLWRQIVVLRSALRIRHPLDPPRPRAYGIKRRAGSIKNSGAKWSALRAYCRLYDALAPLSLENLPCPTSPREAEYIRRHMGLYWAAGCPYSTYGQYKRVQKYKKALEDVREKMARLYKEREEAEKAAWARINEKLEKHGK